MAELTKEFLYEEYVVQKKSTYQIAEENGTYSQKIQRLLKAYEINARTKRKAAKVAMRTGRNIHPTKGKKRDRATIEKISRTTIERIKAETEEERAARIQKAKDRWNGLSEGRKKEINKARMDGVREAAKYGSRIENYCVQRLREAGLSIESHRKELIPSEKLEVDIYIPELRLAIEVDGPTHFLPIWGQSSLEKHIASDNLKNGLLLTNGFLILRVRLMRRSMNKAQTEDLGDRLINIINRIKSGVIENRLMFLDVKED